MASGGDHPDEVARQLDQQAIEPVNMASGGDHHDELARQLDQQAIEPVNMASVGDHPDEVARQLMKQLSIEPENMASVGDHPDELARQLDQQAIETVSMASGGDHPDEVARRRMRQLPIEPEDMASAGDRHNELALQLYKLAKGFARGSSMNKGRSLYRNEEHEFSGRRVTSLEPRKKDNNGDPNNPLNGQENLLGIFFMANVNYYTGEPPNFSPYGAYRLKIPVNFLLTHFAPNDFKLFFNDFFCLNRAHKPHYVTIVICGDGTDDCRFCEKYLLPLPKDNPFFVLSDDKESFQVSSRIWVEVFYMKGIDITEAEANGAIFQKGIRVTSGTFIGGIPKPTSCTTCH